MRLLMERTLLKGNKGRHTDFAWSARLDKAVYMSCCCRDQVRAHVSVSAISHAVQLLCDAFNTHRAIPISFWATCKSNAICAEVDVLRVAGVCQNSKLFLLLCCFLNTVGTAEWCLLIWEGLTWEQPCEEAFEAPLLYIESSSRDGQEVSV